MIINTVIEGAKMAAERGYFKKYNNLEKRKLIRQIQEDNHASRNIDIKNYVFIVIEPAPKLA
jgi:hypothetical protein